MPSPFTSGAPRIPPVWAALPAGPSPDVVAAAAGNRPTGGGLPITDAERGQPIFPTQAGTAGSNGYGTFTLAADGSWTYTADDSQTSIQHISAVQSRTDSVTPVSPDGSASQLVTVTIHGTNDTAVIGGVATGAVTED